MARDIGPRIGIEGEAEYRRAINEITQSQKTLSAEMERTASAFDKNASAQSKSAAKAKTLKQQISQQEKKVQELARMTEMSTQKTGENSVATLKWKEALANAETQLNKLNAELKKNSKLSAFGQDLQKVGQNLQIAGNSMQSVGNTFSKYVSAPIMAAGAVAVKSASDFETAIAKVSTIADTTQTPIDDLKESILSLSDETGIAATDLAESVYNAISAGQETGDAVDFVETTAKLARAGFTSTESALDVLTSIMNAYGLEAKDAAKVSDKLITVQNRGKTTIDQLASTMGKLIPTSAAFGVNLDNISSAYVVMTKNGISTAESTTYINSMLNELGKSGTKASKIIVQRTGKSFKQLMDGGASLADVLKILRDEANNSNLSLADMFGSAEAGKAALSIMSDDGVEFAASMEAMGQAAGSAQQAFDTMSGTSAAQMQKALNQLKNTGIKVGETLLKMAGPGIEAFGEKIEQISDWYDGLSEDTQEMVSKVGLALGIGGPLLSAVGHMTSGIGKGVATVGSLISKFGALASPAGAIALATAAIIGLVKALETKPEFPYDDYEAVQDFLKGIVDKSKEIKDGFEKSNAAIEGIIATADNQITTVQEKYNILADCFDEDGALRQGMEETANYLLNDLANAFGTEFSGAFSDNMQNNLAVLQEVNGALDTYVTKIRQAAVEEAYSSEFASALKAQTEATVNNTAAREAAMTAVEDLTAAEQTYKELQEDIARDAENNVFDFVKMRNADDARVEVERQAKKVEELGAAYAETSGILAEATTRVEGISDAFETVATGDVEKAAEILSNVGTDAKKAGEAVTKNVGGAFEDLGAEIKKFTQNTMLEDFLKGVKIPKPKLTKFSEMTSEQISESLEKEFGKTKTYLDFKRASVGGLAKPIYTAKNTIENGVSNIWAKIGGVNNTAGAASSAWNTMQSIVGRGMTGRISEVVGGKLAAFAAISEAQATADANPIVIRTTTSSSSGSGFLSGVSGYVKRANGAVVNSPQFSLIGEAGPEAIIPLSGARRNRAMSLYRRVGNILGVGGGSNSTTNNNNVNINVYAQPGQSVDEIANAVSRRINAQVYRKGAVFA